MKPGRPARAAVIAFFLLLAPASASADGGFSFLAGPAYWVPSPLDPDAKYYSTGGGAELGAAWAPPFLPGASVGAVADYGYAQSGALFSLSTLAASGLLGYDLPLSPSLYLALRASGGWAFSFPNERGIDLGRGSLFYGGGLGLGIALSPALALEVGAGYRARPEFYDALRAAAVLRLAVGGGKGSPAATPAAPRPAPLKAGKQRPPKAGAGLEAAPAALPGVFPLLHAWYDDHPIGSIRIRNADTRSAEEVKVSVFIRQYMDAPKESETIASLAPGEEREVELRALFKGSILELTQATKVAAEISVAWTMAGRPGNLARTDTLRVYDRNAMTWDDDRKAAAFVTAKEPAVLSFSNNVNAAVKASMSRALDPNLQAGIALHDATRLYGIEYVANPLAPYAAGSKDRLAVDSLKFPRQTLEYRSGDCADLSILYCALLESIGIETAFVTVPGHIFMAFALKAGEDEARKSLSRSDDLVFRGGRAWLPVETTARAATFLEAWQAAAKEWRENQSRGTAAFLPVHEAWELYEPVFLPGQAPQPAMPAAAAIAAEFRAEASRLVEREIFSKVEELRAGIERSQGSPASHNALGVLYARYALSEKAEGEFRKAVEREEHLPALVNLGNLEFLRPDMEAALSWFERAGRVAPSDPRVLLALARTSHALEDYRSSRKSYDELKRLDPGLAARYAYLELKGEEALRAAAASGSIETVEWAE